MPTYNYLCIKCNNEFVVLQNMSDKKFSVCDEVCENNCKDKGELIRKISGGTGLLFKGDGFYITDYKNRKTNKKKYKKNDKNKSDNT